MNQRKILVTSALPYANGPIHIGHLVEYIQTDIWVRFQKMQGNKCYYICASDAHGTPIMLRAEEENISAEELIATIGAQHKEDFDSFNVEFDNFHTTHSPENREIVEQIYKSLRRGGYIKSRSVEQFYDPVKSMFLPDRFIRGSCPSCKAVDQYGDSCEKCGAAYSPLDLIDPVSVLTDVRPEVRESDHLFFTLGDFVDTLKEWLASHELHESVKNKLEEWFAVGLKDWDISRDKPYFGFEIPDYPGKYFYVWLDAPIGYLGSFKNYCDKHGMNFDSFTRGTEETEMYHFIGKDIMYFHSLFWPAMLSASGFKLPDNVFVHGFLTVDGKKMSKSRGTYITAKQYLAHLDPEHLRYYFAAKISPGIEDIDLKFDDYVSRVNADLVGKFVNIGSRCAGFIQKNFDGKLSDELDDPELLRSFQVASGSIATSYEKREYGRALRNIMGLADQANQYIDNRKPWVTAKENQTNRSIQKISTQGLMMFRILAIYLKPVLPNMARKVELFFGESSFVFSSVFELPLGKTINKFSSMTLRVDKENVKKMLRMNSLGGRKQMGAVQNAEENEITIEDFSKIDFRVATVLEAREIQESKKLVELKLDLGADVKKVFAGIKGSYEPSAIVGKKVIYVANLKPRKMRFGVSEGMILGASAEEDGMVFLISPDEGSKAGMSVK